VALAPASARAGSQSASSVDPQVSAAAPAPAATRDCVLTRTQAEQLAIKNNPRISVGRLLALAQHQIYRETRAAELPNFNGAITAVEANEGSRIGAGALTASRLLEHAGAGVTLSQLITDFGRTMNLVSSAKLQERRKTPMRWPPPKISFSPRTRLFTTRSRPKLCSRLRNKR